AHEKCSPVTWLTESPQGPGTDGLRAAPQWRVGTVGGCLRSLSTPSRGPAGKSCPSPAQPNRFEVLGKPPTLLSRGTPPSQQPPRRQIRAISVPCLPPGIRSMSLCRGLKRKRKRICDHRHTLVE